MLAAPMRRWTGRQALLALGAALSAVFSVGVAYADGGLGPNGSPIATSDYAVDLQQGVFLGGSQATGLAGAYVAIAEGLDGAAQNPASSAVRKPWSYTHFDFDWSASLTLPGFVRGNDFFNSGEPTTDVGSVRSGALDFLFINGALNLQLGPWGFNFGIQLQRYDLRRTQDATEPTAERTKLEAQFATTRVQLAKHVDDNLAIGLGLRGVTLSILEANSELFSSSGVGLEAGILYKPIDMPFRLGAAVRSPVATEPSPDNRARAIAGTSDIVVAENPDAPDLSAPSTIFLPRRVVLPAEFDLGAAFKFGTRPFNPRWSDPDRLLEELRRYMSWRAAERRRKRASRVAAATGRDSAAYERALRAEDDEEDALDRAQLTREERRVDQLMRRKVRSMSRDYLLLSTSVTVSLPVVDAVGIESFLQRRVNRSGRQTTFTPRFGLEGEVVPNILRARFGSYLEPTRFETPLASPRLHGTVGADFKVLRWDLFGINPPDTDWYVVGTLDVADRYFGWGIGIGTWH